MYVTELQCCTFVKSRNKDKWGAEAQINRAATSSMKLW